MGRIFLVWIISWVLLFPAYLLYVGSVKGSELAAGAAASAGSALLFLLLHLHTRESFRPRLRWFIPAFALPWAILWETCLLIWMLARRSIGMPARGKFFHYPFSRKEDRHTAALRSFVIYGVCVSPNSYLVDMEKEEKTALIRQLAGRNLSRTDRSFLELK